MPSTAAESVQINPSSIDEDHVHVVAAIIRQTAQPDRFLIAQRPVGKHLAGYWEFPGGKVEASEAPRQALERELHEEIGIRVVDAQAFMQVYYRYPERNVLLDTWMVLAYDGEVQACENQKLMWIGTAEIENYAFPPADEPILEALKRAAG